MAGRKCLTGVVFLALDRTVQYGMLLVFRASHLILSAFHGVWLGILSRKAMYEVGERTYGKGKGSYRNSEWNKKGLFDWEEEVVKRHFSSCRTILVAGAGGGREVYALRRMGYEADGFDCNPRLVDSAQELFRKEGMPVTFLLAEPDSCPAMGRIYDGLIVGWGAFTHIEGSGRRIAFLRQMRRCARTGSPLLISFFSRTHMNRLELKMTYLCASIVRRLLGRQGVGYGDSLNLTGYAHFFSRDEIAAELEAAGFRLASYSENGPCAVGIAV